MADRESIALPFRGGVACNHDALNNARDLSHPGAAAGEKNLLERCKNQCIGTFCLQPQSEPDGIRYQDVPAYELDTDGNSVLCGSVCNGPVTEQHEDAMTAGLKAREQPGGADLS